MKRYPKTGRQMLAVRCGKWKISYVLKGGFHRGDKSRGDLLRCLACYTCPDFCQVGFRCIREAEG
jgi:hypothetical protein